MAHFLDSIFSENSGFDMVGGGHQVPQSSYNRKRYYTNTFDRARLVEADKSGKEIQGVLKNIFCKFVKKRAPINRLIYLNDHKKNTQRLNL